MANVTVDQAKLVLNSFAAIFQNNLISKDLVTWRKFDSEMNDRNALTVVEQIGPRYTVTRTTSNVADLTAGVQDSVFGSEQYKVQDVFGSSMGWGDFVKIRDMNDARESQAIKNAAMNLAETIDGYILGYAALASNNWTGNPANPVSDYDDVASGYTRLKEEGVEDVDVKAVLTYGDKQALGSAITTNNASLPDVAGGVYRNGWTGEIAGIPTLFTQQLPTLTTGTRTNGTMNAAAQNVNYSAVAISSAPGNYLTQTINITGLGATGTIVDGEVFTIAGVNAWDNRLGASIGRLQQFRVIGNYTATGGAVTNLRIFPAIIVPGTGTGGDINVNKANATVDSVPAAAAAVTFFGNPSTPIKPRLLINKQSIIVSTADLITPATGTSSRKALTQVPLSVRMWQDSVFATGEHRVRFDVALSANTSDRRRITRISG